MNWLKALLASRKFKTALFDMVISLLIFVLGTLLTEVEAKFWLTIIAIIQPVFFMVIAGTAWEDAAAKKAGTFLEIKEKNGG